MIAAAPAIGTAVSAAAGLVPAGRLPPSSSNVAADIFRSMGGSVWRDAESVVLVRHYLRDTLDRPTSRRAEIGAASGVAASDGQ
jgi:hypothetical protein